MCIYVKASCEPLHAACLFVILFSSAAEFDIEDSFFPEGEAEVHPSDREIFQDVNMEMFA